MPKTRRHFAPLWVVTVVPSIAVAPSATFTTVYIDAVCANNVNPGGPSVGATIG